MTSVEVRRFKRYDLEKNGKDKKAQQRPLTVGNLTVAQVVPVHHCDMRTSPVTPPTGAPWYAIQSTVTLTYVFLSFYPAAITQAVNPLLITLSIHDTAASWTWDLLLVLI